MLKLIFVVLAFVPNLVFAANYGPDLLPGLTPSCDSFESGGGGFPCANVNDGNLATRWISANNLNQHYVKFDTVASSTPGKIRFNLVKDGAFTGLQSFSVFGSHDDSTYLSLLASTSITTASDGEWQDFIWSASTTGYRYIKIIGYAENNGGLEHEITFWEVQLFDELFPSTMSDTVLEFIFILLVFGTFCLGFLIMYRLLR